MVTATGTITNNNGAPTISLSVDPSSVNEGDHATTVTASVEGGTFTRNTTST